MSRHFSNFDEMMRVHEGYETHLYKDTQGLWTIGIGHCIELLGLTDEQIEKIFEDDVHEARLQLYKALPWVSELDEVRQDVLLDMAFNLGVEKLLEFKQTLAAVKDGNWEEAAAQMLDSHWAEQVGIRAQELAEMMKSGKYPE